MCYQKRMIRRSIVLALVAFSITVTAGAASTSPWGDGRWASRGPTNLSGLVTTLLLDPDDPAVYLAGTPAGLWLSRDAGGTWSMVDSILGNSIDELARDPVDHDVLYAASAVAGIFKSSDRGTTWTRITSDVRPYSIAVSADGKRLLASTALAIHLSTDGGATWPRVLLGGVTQGRVRFHPSDPLRAVAVLPSLNSDQEDTGYVTAGYSADGGLTWSVSAGLDLESAGVTLDYCRSESAPVIAYSTGEFASTGTIWRSDDGGATFRKLGTARTSSGGMRIIAIAAAPSDPDLIVAGAITARRTRDGGKTDDDASLIVDGLLMPHADVRGIAADLRYDGVQNKRFFVWGDGGIYRTDDITATPVQWTYLASGLATTQIYDFDVSPSGRVVMGMQDTGVALMNGGTTSVSFRSDGDVAQIAFDPTDERVFYTAFFGDNSGGVGTVHKWVDTTEYLQFVNAQDGRLLLRPGLRAFQIDPNDATRMFIGSGTVLRVEGIQAVPKPARTTLLRRYADPAFMTTIAVQPGNSNVVWVGVNDNPKKFPNPMRVERTANALSDSPTWEPVGQFNSYGPLLSITLDEDPKIVFILFNNALLASRDGGSTWQNIIENAPAAWRARGLSTFIRHPQNKEWWYVGGPGGLYVTTDRGVTWEAAPRFVAVPVRAMRFVQNQLWAAVWSHGLWSLDVPPPAVPRRRSARH